MADMSGNDLVAGVGRDMVMRLAPQEMPLFRANCDAFFRDPQRALRGRTSKDEMLGFGATEADESARFLTPAVLAVTQAVVDFITTDLGKTNPAVFKKFREGSGGTAGAPALSAEQLARVRQVALDKARAVKLNDQQAASLADAIMASLATSA